MRIPTKTVALAASFAAVATLGLSACSKSDTSSTSAMTTTASASMDDPASDLVGPGCGDYAKLVPSGAGSVAGMAKDPVTVAASNNPMLSTLVSALSGKLNPNVNLIDTLNSGEFTVFAPTNDAFAKLPAETIEKLKTDSDLLTKILTYHVVSGQNKPANIIGEFKTVEGGTVKVTGPVETLKVNTSGLVCGGVKTANATVYMIDTVLTPPAA
ncbi:fasciclin domain-containing protein [Smaragdicoccus niigatensis]|uniref:fasciclin domain-containing protein n=1 Tax=Smaragdicoccus niigatensis TaxID=359359 RepID=UPI0003AB404E|nr:fasciclin domain-containing protein [Smaragdicoccus niigatensis]